MCASLRSTLTIVVVIVAFGGTPPVWGADAACNMTTLAQCPAKGCSTDPAHYHPIINMTKRAWPTGATAVHLDFDDLVNLQAQADQLFGPNRDYHRDLTQQDRSLLQHLPVSGGRHVSEGQLVQIAGYIAGYPKRPTAEPGESVNCGLRERKNSDFHIPIVAQSGDSEFTSIVTEMIPQRRPAAWTLPAVRTVAKDQVQVLIRGKLFFDNLHALNGDEQHPVPRQPKRRSLWEVHPITEFYICERNSCDPDRLSEWTAWPKVNVPQ